MATVLGTAGLSASELEIAFHLAIAEKLAVFDKAAALDTTLALAMALALASAKMLALSAFAVVVEMIPALAMEVPLAAVFLFDTTALLVAVLAVLAT